MPLMAEVMAHLSQLICHQKGDTDHWRI